MKYLITIIFISALTYHSSAQVNDTKLNVRLIDYLTGYCDVGENESFIDFIKLNQVALEPLLATYVESGPPSDLVNGRDDLNKMNFERRQKTLAQSSSFGLQKSDLELIQNESFEAYSNNLNEEFVNGFISESIFGLSLIESEKSKSIIDKIANDDRNPYQRYAINAVNQVYLQR